MKAVRIREVGKLELIETDIPPAAAEDCLAESRIGQHLRNGLHQLGGKVPVALPRIPGHDFSGTIAELGKESAGLCTGSSRRGQTFLSLLYMSCLSGRLF